MDRPEIVVGIDGSDTARAAMYWAAIEADRRNAELVLAHAGDADAHAGDVHVDAGDVHAGPAPHSGRPTGYGRELLTEAAAEVYEAGAECPLSSVITPEDPVRLLTELSKRADLLVVGSHGLSRQSSRLLGGVAFQVAAHAHCPVAIVPRGWDEQAQHSKPVVVGIPATAASAAPLYAAFAEARSRGVPVQAVRARSRIDWTGELTDTSTLPPELPDFLDQLLAPVHALFPDVPVQVVLSGKRVDELMSEATTGAGLFVLGSRYPDGHSYSRLGATTARLIHKSRCPALVVGRAPAPVSSEPPAEGRLAVPRWP